MHRHNKESKANFDNSGYKLLLKSQKMPSLCPQMWKVIFMLLITFPSSYLVEAGFSALNQILAKKINSLIFSERLDIRMMLTKIEPDIRDLGLSINYKVRT